MRKDISFVDNKNKNKNSFFPRVIINKQRLQFYQNQPPTLILIIILFYFFVRYISTFIGSMSFEISSFLPENSIYVLQGSQRNRTET